MTDAGARADGRFADGLGPMRVSGRQRLPDTAAPAEVPLIIALHGGTYHSAYFDLPGYSLLDRAEENAIPIMALDRPSYGETAPLPPGTETIAHSAERLDQIIAGLHRRAANPRRGIVLIGHSIGGGIALAIAARAPSWPLLGVAISGICLESPPEAGTAWDALPATTLVELPAALKDAVMFGPAGSYELPMPDLSHQADAPVPRAELIDVVTGWPAMASATLGGIRVPVHYRQAEHDRLWVTDAGQVANFAALLANAPLVDAALLPGAGHCIDFHRGGAAFQLEQLAFARQCGVRGALPA